MDFSAGPRCLKAAVVSVRDCSAGYTLDQVISARRHPFTISSAPSDPFASVHIRQAGDFTKTLGERLGCTSALAAQLTREANHGSEKTGSRDIAYGAGHFYDITKAVQHLPVLRVDGPFGTAAEDVFDCEVAVLIGTGIGVTPWASVLKNIG